MKNALKGLPLRLYPVCGKPDGRRVTTGSVFPYRLTNAAKARIIKRFEEEGSTTHSGMGLTLGVVIEHCLKNDINFKLYRTDGGFFIRKTR